MQQRIGRAGAGILVLAAMLGLFLLSTGSALAARLSSIVIDASTGQVLSADNPDLRNYPASLTKMMTLYLTFEALEQGRIHLDTRFIVSPLAQSQEPTKINLVAGESVTVHNLILGLVTQSANDAAVVLSEGIGGTESAFAAQMTAKARALGMSNTTYYNANGLPNPGQMTTARDVATLALALYRRFPHEYAYFSTQHFIFNGVDYHNHNHLMSSYQGMDGIKTGFIHASGFNIATSAVRNGRRLIGVVMGGESAHGRDMQMAQLLDAAFAGTGDNAPDLRMASAQPSHSNLDAIAHRAIAALSPVGRAEAATVARAPQHLTLRPAAHPVKVAAARPEPRNAAEHWSIQVGAYRAHASAINAGSVALEKLPAARGKNVIVVASRAAKGPIFRTRIVNFSESGAQNACKALHRQHKPCAIVAPGTQEVATHVTFHRG